MIIVSLLEDPLIHEPDTKRPGEPHYRVVRNSEQAHSFRQLVDIHYQRCTDLGPYGFEKIIGVLLGIEEP